MGRLRCPAQWKSARAPGVPSIAWLVCGSVAVAAHTTSPSVMARTRALASQPHSAGDAQCGVTVTAIVLATAFVAWEQCADEPMVPMRLFGARAFSSGIAAILPH